MSDERLKMLEQAVGELAERGRAQFEQTMHLGVLIEWVALKAQESGIELDMEEGFPKFIEAKRQQFQEAFEQIQKMQEAQAQGADLSGVNLDDTNE